MHRALSQPLLEFRRGPKADGASRCNCHRGFGAWIKPGAGLMPAHGEGSESGHPEALVFANRARNLIEGQFNSRRYTFFLLSRNARDRFDQFRLGHQPPSTTVPRARQLDQFALVTGALHHGPTYCVTGVTRAIVNHPIAILYRPWIVNCIVIQRDGTFEPFTVIFNCTDYLLPSNSHS